MELSSSDAPHAEPVTELRALVKLRERVEAAAREIEQLKIENARLIAKLTEAQQQPSEVSLQSLGGFDGDVDALRAQLRDFIETIDQTVRLSRAAEPEEAA